MNKLKRLIYYDCRRTMALPLIFSTLEECLGGLLTIYTANVLGKFADAVFVLDLSYGITNIWKLLLCIGVTVLGIPLLGLVCDVLTLKYSLKNDRIIMERFLDKEYAKAMEIEPGEAQYRLENDPTEFRYHWMKIIGKLIVIPVTLNHLRSH